MGRPTQAKRSSKEKSYGTTRQTKQKHGKDDRTGSGDADSAAEKAIQELEAAELRLAGLQARRDREEMDAESRNKADQVARMELRIRRKKEKAEAKQRLIEQRKENERSRKEEIVAARKAARNQRIQKRKLKLRTCASKAAATEARAREKEIKMAKQLAEEKERSAARESRRIAREKANKEKAEKEAAVWKVKCEGFRQFLKENYEANEVPVENKILEKKETRQAMRAQQQNNVRKRHDHTSVLDSRINSIWDAACHS